MNADTPPAVPPPPPTEPPPDQRPPNPHRAWNFGVLMCVSALFGIAVAVYENVLPLFLDEIDISFATMGYIFASAATVAVFVRVAAGSWSDRNGRRPVYFWSLLAQAAACTATPLARAAVAQGVIKSVRDPAMKIRETMHSVLLYEESPKKFIDVLGKTRGMEFLFRFFGLLLAAFAVRRLATVGVGSPVEWLLLVSGMVIGGATLLFGLGYREHKHVRDERPKLGLFHLLRPQLNRELWILAAAEFVFMIGLTCSHSFAMQLFWKERFGVGAGAVLVIMALHRLLYAVPLMVVGRVIKRRLKTVYVTLLVVEGVLIAVPAFLPSLWLAAGVWLLHDLFGAGLWMPAQHMLLQRHSHPNLRGTQVSLVLALGSIGTIFGPLLAGWLMGLQGVDPAFSAGLPFVASGVFLVLAAGIVSRL